MMGIGVIGAGAWGTALAINLASSGKQVGLWGRDLSGVTEARENERHLPGIPFPQSLVLVHHLEALRLCRTLLLVTPAQTMRAMATALAEHIEPTCRLVICAKGIEQGTGKRLSQVVHSILPHNTLAVLSGPSFASEVAANLPTAATLASADGEAAVELAAFLSTSSLRLYHTTDVAGVELAGALKNVVAIACGMAIGHGLGENARAALMTRGLAEIARLGTALGARADTFMGLAGLGDLALTCASKQSRNFSLGHRIGAGETLMEAAAGRLVEGVATTTAALTLAHAHDITLPVVEAIQSVLFGHSSIDTAMAALMSRPLRAENE